MINELFVGWYDYSKEEYESILLNGLISLDTNVLLNLYRYSKETSTETLTLFSSIGDRIVFSYYVAEEFTRNRKKVEADSILEYSKYISDIDNRYKDLMSEINSIPDKRLSEKKKLITSINKNKEKIITSITTEKNKKEKMFSEGLESKICELMNHRILNKYSDKDFKKIRDEGLRRIKEQIPPGYKDSQKSENGDYHIFKSLIDYCKEKKKDLIFVTDDTKDDIFTNLHGKRFPRSELLNEFYNETGQKLLIFTVQEFLKNRIIFKEKVSEDILSEISFTSIENLKYSPRTNSRIKRYLYNILKNNSIDDVINNYEEIQKSFRTIVRICEGINDEDSAKKFNSLIRILNDGDYELYLTELLSINEIVLQEKENEVKRISSYYEKYKETNIKEIGIELGNLMITYINEYMNENYKAKTMAIKLRELLKGVKSDYVSDEILSSEIDNTYNYIMTGEDNYASI